MTVEVEGRRLSLSNLDKVLYPSVGLVKGEVVDYYTRIAPVLLPHVQARPMTFTRWPDGVDGQELLREEHPQPRARLGPSASGCRLRGRP